MKAKTCKFVKNAVLFIPPFSSSPLLVVDGIDGFDDGYEMYSKNPNRAARTTGPPVFADTSA